MYILLIKKPQNDNTKGNEPILILEMINYFDSMS